MRIPCSWALATALSTASDIRLSVPTKVPSISRNSARMFDDGPFCMALLYPVIRLFQGTVKNFTGSRLLHRERHLFWCILKPTRSAAAIIQKEDRQRLL